MDQGALLKVFNAKNPPGSLEPFVVQIVHMKSISQTEHKYRMLLGDGEWLIQAILEGPCGEQIHNQGIERGTCIKVLEYLVVNAAAKRLIILKNVEAVPTVSPSYKSKDLKPVETYYQAHPDEDLFASEDKPAASATSGSPATHMRESAAPLGRKVTMIEALSLYSNIWTIKARVTYKGDLRTWSNKNTEGKLINFNLLDELDEISATAFGETADRLERELQKGKVYYFLKGKIKDVNPRFNTLSHRFCITFDKEAVIEECFDQLEIPKFSFNFVKLDQVPNLEISTTIDVIGVLKHVLDLMEFTSKTGHAHQKRTITIVDDTGYAIEVGLWNKVAAGFSLPEGLVVALKHCKISEFNGSRNLSLAQSGACVANPDLPESYRLKGWYDNLGTATDFKLLKQDNSSGSNPMDLRKTIYQVTSENLGRLEKPDYFSIRASTSFLRTSGTIAYPACVNEVNNNGRTMTCNRKIIQDGDQWRCERCNITVDEPTYRYVLTALLLDESGQIWATFFDAEATKLLGISATELMLLMNEEDEGKTASTAVFEAATWKEYNFRIKAKLDLYNDEERVRYQVVGMHDIDYNAESEHLADVLAKRL